MFIVFMVYSPLNITEVSGKDFKQFYDLSFNFYFKLTWKDSYFWNIIDSKL